MQDPRSQLCAANFMSYRERSWDQALCNALWLHVALWLSASPVPLPQDLATDEWVVHTPDEGAIKWWIGNAAEDGRAATVFARLKVFSHSLLTAC